MFAIFCRFYNICFVFAELVQNYPVSDCRKRTDAINSSSLEKYSESLRRTVIRFHYWVALHRRETGADKLVATQTTELGSSSVRMPWRGLQGLLRRVERGEYPKEFRTCVRTSWRDGGLRLPANDVDRGNTNYAIAFLNDLHRLTLILKHGSKV